MLQKISRKRIREIVIEDHLFASVLHYFGIPFYDYEDHTLEEVCKENSILPSEVVAHYESQCRSAVKLDFRDYSIEVLVAYLKHGHKRFIKELLPYHAELVRKSFDKHPTEYLQDLNLIFPIFVEDFIRHIYHEEDTLFHYIHALRRYARFKDNYTEVVYLMEHHSMAHFAMEHADEDEMEGIRSLTGNYTKFKNTDLCYAVLLQELKAFDEALQHHAYIENHLLFQKAYHLENYVKKALGETIKLN
jgi:regulator of cell morphogenesis and NO signaling